MRKQSQAHILFYIFIRKTPISPPYHARVRNPSYVRRTNAYSAVSIAPLWTTVDHWRPLETILGAFVLARDPFYIRTIYSLGNIGELDPGFSLNGSGPSESKLISGGFFCYLFSPPVEPVIRRGLSLYADPAHKIKMSDP